MSKQIRHIIIHTIYIFVTCIACVASHGCTHENFPDEDNPDSFVQVSFRIRLSEQYGTRTAETRAGGSSLPYDYDDPTKYEAGTGYENYIGITNNDFYFLLFDGDGKFLETMSVLGIFSASGSEHSSEYNVLCSLTNKPEGSFKVMALANWGVGNYPRNADLDKGVTTVDDVCESSTYVYNQVPFTPSAKTPIPMYGVKTCDISLETGKHNDIGDLYLLRAMAKVEVVCRENSGLELASVNLTRHNTKGFRTPDGMNANTSYVSAAHIPDDAVSNDTPLAFHISADKSKAVIYIPEYRNTGTGPYCQLYVTFTDNTDKQYTVDFREYSSGKPAGGWLDILRNCCYHFTVDKTAKFEVDLIPYGVVELYPGFGID